MDKRGITLTLESIAGIVLAAFIILGLTYGIFNIYNAVFPDDVEEKLPEGNFNKFAEKLNLLLKTNSDFVHDDTLIVSYPNIVFGLNNKDNLHLPVRVQRFDSIGGITEVIKRPSECKDKSCICQCSLKEPIPFSESEVQCYSNISCMILEGITEITEEDGKVSLIYYRDKYPDFIRFESPRGPFYVHPKRSSQINLNIIRKGSKLVFSFSPS